MTTSAIQYLECPHCYANVMFREDGICLSCCKSRFDTTGIKRHETMINIDHNHRLPSCCFLCGEQTKLKKDLSWSYYIGTRSSWLGLIFSYVPGSHNRSIHRINMSVCQACLPAAKRVKPLNVIAGLECRLRVHRNFRIQFEKLNGKETMEWDVDISVSKAPDKFLLNIGKDIWKL